MPYILLIESSTPCLSVALVKDEEVVAHRELEASKEHAAILLTFVDEVISEAHIRPANLDAIAVSKGPGSYTGLRIGVSSAKGLCYALDKPLIAISPLQSIATEVARKIKQDNTTCNSEIICAMQDAGRMEVYAGLYNILGQEIRKVKAEIVDENTYLSYLENRERNVFFAGDGMEKCRDILRKHTNAVFIPDLSPCALYMAPLAIAAYQNKNFEDTAYFTPFYLKDFVAGKPSVKGLHTENHLGL